MERAALADGIGFAVLNLMSDNPGMRWDIETTKRTIGYAPRDGAAPAMTDAVMQNEHRASDLRRRIEQLEAEAAQAW
jgi:NAD+ dependent glucose-6-phosphate dehydrogenase